MKGKKIKIKKSKKTIQKSYLWEFCMVFCIMLMLPVNISLLFSKREGKETQWQDELSEEEYEKDIFKSELEWAVLHELARTIPIEYELETMKAQAIILRTNILADQIRNDQPQSDQLQTDQARQDQTQQDPTQQDQIQTDWIQPDWEKEKKDRTILLYAYRESWGSDYEKNCEKLYDAVIQTRGMYLEKDHKPIHASFFRLSNGSTRTAAECIEGDHTEYVAVECRKDLTSDDFIKRERIESVIFTEKISRLTGQTFSYEQLKETEILYQNDSAGYVLEVDIGGEKIGGEIFRQAFLLPSSDFFITYEDDSVLIETKGIGTGIGFCQYGANEMAKEGEDFLKLLEYFFTNIAISKSE